jgi:hypothetical protein
MALRSVININQDEEPHQKEPSLFRRGQGEVKYI